MKFNYQGTFLFDVSTYQDAPTIPGNVNFQKMRDYGASAVIIRAGQGKWVDQDFYTNWQNSKGVLPRSSYFYYDNLYPPKDQARMYWSIIQHDVEGICFLDLEDRLLGAYQGWKAWYDFLTEFKTISGLPDEQIGIYTNFYYWIEAFRFSADIEKYYFLRYPLWLASYPADPFHPNYENILVPPPWTEAVLLQSGTPAIGEQVGVESKEVDYSQFNENFPEYKKYFTPVGEVEPMTDYMKLEPSVAGEYRSIRQQTSYPDVPHITGAKIGQIDQNSSAKALPTDFYVYLSDIYVSGILRAKTGDKWWKVYEANGSPIVGWVAETHLGVKYLNTTLVTETPPPTSHLVEVYVDGVLEYRKELL